MVSPCRMNPRRQAVRSLPWIGLSFSVFFGVCCAASIGAVDDVSRRPEGRREEVKSTGERRIIGGAADCLNYPWVARTINVFASFGIAANLRKDQYREIGKQGVLCTGSLISGTFLVTAAHCFLTDPPTGFVSVEPIGSTTVVVGCQDVQSRNCRTREAKRILIHPCYTASTDQDHDDIAIVELTEDAGLEPQDYALFDNVHGPANLKAGDTVSLLGFGLESNNAMQGSSKVMSVDVPVATKSVCEGANPWDLARNYINFDNVICTGGTSGKDSCAGDSGGAAVKRYLGRDYVVGILSKGSQTPVTTNDCAVQGRYGVYTKVSKYADWINAVVMGKGTDWTPCADCSTRKCTAPDDLYKTYYPNGPTWPIKQVVAGGGCGTGNASRTTINVTTKVTTSSNTVSSASEPLTNLWVALFSAVLAVEATRKYLIE